MLSAAAEGTVPATLALLASRLRALRAQAQPWVAAHLDAMYRPPAGPCAPAPSPAGVARLRELLLTQDLEAQRVFKGLAASLGAVLSAEHFARLRLAIERLHFASAAVLLQEAAQPA